MFQIFYVSALSERCDARVVGDIFQLSREQNPRRGITGALVFDGAHFAQLLQGERDTVEPLMARIALDPRHDVLAVLLQTHTDAGPLHERWLAGYCEPDTVLPLVALAGAPPAQVLAAFQALLAAADMA